MDEMQGTLEKNLQQMRASNQQRLQQLQTKPDHNTMETCLNVSAQLDQAAKGLSELQLMAGGSLDVGRILNHLKMRGPWAEVGAEELLDAVLSVNQYRAQVSVRPQSVEKADFVVVLPGTQEDETRPVYLPILTGFPAHENALLMYAMERQEPAAIEAASRALEQALRAQAYYIREAFVEPPFTTDYAILYLPTEGLYAQLVQDSVLREELQQQYRVLLSGPSTMASLLSSLQAGLRARVMEQRAKELRVSLSRARERLDVLQGSASSARQSRPADMNRPPERTIYESHIPDRSRPVSPPVSPPVSEDARVLLEAERRRFEQFFGGNEPPLPPPQSAFDGELDRG
ncbi:MAG: DNA recombination protein RmuC, partial [Clostridia bacterium]|nr:DNA recombination protein RmuC [Clostridia bacterium]